MKASADTRAEYRCSLAQIQHYRFRISGALLDRIDVHVKVSAVTYRKQALPLGGPPCKTASNPGKPVLVSPAFGTV